MNYDFTENSEYDFENRMVAPEYTPEDAEVENPLRPKRLGSPRFPLAYGNESAAGHGPADRQSRRRRILP